MAGLGCVLAVMGFAATARAEDSAQGPLYVQGGIGLSFWWFPITFGPFSNNYSWAGFWPTVEFGWHPSGRHDGFEIGVRQAFIITALGGNFVGSHAGGTTAARGGYDFAFKAGSMEINVDPFATFGVGYVFDGPHAGIEATGGIDLKLFIAKGAYVYVRPAELGFQCFHDSGRCAFSYAAAAGGGIAFGK